MSIRSETSVSADDLMKGLQHPKAYPHKVDGLVEILETHISIVFLAGDFAYKIKKPIKTDFLDYSTLERRKHCCDEELRLDRRYASELYLEVVPIGWDGRRLRIHADSEPVEYAVKMRRFSQDALLSQRIADGKLTSSEVLRLAETVASFHQTAAICESDLASGWTDFLVKNVHQIVSQLQTCVDDESAASLRVLHAWSDDYFGQHLRTFAARIDDGFLRECHGDLHLQNIVHWRGRLIPFDGIEFNERLRWIDVLCDSAFLAMDFAARGHLEMSRSFMNAYLERTGDYSSLVVLRWFLLYRSLVRALAASMRASENNLVTDQRQAIQLDILNHIDLAYRFTLKETPQLWITHGVSGSGKTTLSEAIVQRHEAFRLRSDIERKRRFGLSPTERPSPELQSRMHTEEADEQTYSRLRELASGILQAGYSVIVDATFLDRRERERFHELARQHGVAFSILDCHSDEQTLRQRVADRMARNDDASDADLRILEHQLASYQPLTESEKEHVVDIPDLVRVVEHL